MKDYFSHDIDTAVALAAEDDYDDVPSHAEISEDVRPIYSPQTMELVNRVIRLKQREADRRIQRERRD